MKIVCLVCSSVLIFFAVNELQGYAVIGLLSSDSDNKSIRILPYLVNATNVYRRKASVWCL